jgi:DNA-binding response OmpR family regulator
MATYMEKKILIIEDEESLLDMYKSRFEKAGYQVLTANDGKSGIEIIQKQRPDLVILDILMPEMDGYETIKKIRKNAQIKKIPILVLSNLGQPDEINKALKLGADDYVVKTEVTPTELFNKVERMFLHIRKSLEKIKKRVLIIEDESEIAQLYQEKLIQEGFEVEVANNGAWGLRLAHHGDFDIILLDMVMPAMSGYEAIRQLKKDLRTKEIPILVFSNSAQEKEISRALKMGAEDYFVKARITPSQVVEEIKRVLRNR